jgi:hypothetical protein
MAVLVGLVVVLIVVMFVVGVRVPVVLAVVVVGVVVVVLVGVVMHGVCPSLPPRPNLAPQQPTTDRDHEQAGHQLQDGVQPIGRELRRCNERDGCQREHARRVRDGHRQPQSQRVPRRAAGAHQVRRHHGLPMSW